MHGPIGVASCGAAAHDPQGSPVHRLALVITLVLPACGRGPLWFFGDDGPIDTPRGECDEADFLFVIDDSPSMQVHQRDLADNVPAFLDGVERALASGTDLHVGVTTTDPYYGNTGACRTLGGLVSATVGANSSNSACGPFAAGGNYMTEDDPLAEAFACAAKVGTLGDDTERPLASALAALDANGDAATCNAGFLRDDALLVLVLLTDEGDQSKGDPSGLARQLATMKGDNEEAVVVVTLADAGCAVGEPPCFDWRLKQFTQAFAHGFLGSIDDDYAEQFDAAVDIVADVCGAEG
ncbi:MAG: hypothetical protein IPH07_25535 [Deltaproteobacteria bacterium]|nr:hypothetical protein [Deltaproteobacteria bacterium]